MNKKEWEFSKNSFDIIRLLSAVFIIIGHASQHLRCPVPTAVAIVQQRWIGLFCLFTMTGYLIPASIERSKSAREYFAKRVSRVYPALWVAFAVSLLAVVAFGVCYQKLQVPFQAFVTWAAAQLTVFQFYTPGALEQYGVGNPNGSLWTISMELQIYVLVYILYNWLKKQKPATWLVLIISAIFANVLFPFTEPYIPEIVFKLINVTFIPYLYIYLIGMFAYFYRDKIVLFLRDAFPILLLLYVVWCILKAHVFSFSLGHYTDIVSGVFICILTIGAGYFFGNHRLKYDFSYSLYLYHMIIINVLVVLGITQSIYSLLLTLALSFVCSVLSVVFVERQGRKWVEGRLKINC